MSLVPDSIRREMRQALLQLGTPPHAVDETVDLAIHAAETAFKTVEQVLDRASDGRVKITAWGPAYSILLTLTQGGIETLQKVADKQGFRHGQFSLGGDQQ